MSSEAGHIFFDLAGSWNVATESLALPAFVIARCSALPYAPLVMICKKAPDINNLLVTDLAYFHKISLQSNEFQF